MTSDHVAAVFGPGQGDIEKPDPLRKPFPVRTQLMKGLGRQANIAKKKLILISSVTGEYVVVVGVISSFPDKGTEYHGIFQPLAFMDGNYSYGMRIALKPELMFV